MIRILAGFLILCMLYSCAELTEPCTINNAVVSISECTSDSTYSLTLDFESRNAPSNSFDLFVRADEPIGYYSLDSLPLTIKDFKLSGLDYDYLKICINDDTTCCAELEFEAPDCSHLKCEIGELTIDPGECTGENMYNLYLNFEYANADNEFFDVFVRNNELVGTYKLADLPITIENYQNSGNEYDFIKVCINDNEDCCSVKEFKAPDCTPRPCEIGELNVDPGECTGDNMYNLYLNFEYANANNELFNVYVRENKLIGTYKLADLPITLENFESSGNEYDFIKVCINDNQDCCSVKEFKAPDCKPKPCEIGELNVDPGECTGENMYNLYLNFEYANANNELFNVYARENKLIGTYKLADLPITIENFESSGNDYDFIKVCINDNQDCCSVKEFPAPDCKPKPCEIGELNVDPGECTGENLYNLYLNFEYANANNELFNVYARDNELVGTYKLADLPITIENFESSGNDYDFIKVCINDNEDCCSVKEFKAPDCKPKSCEISNLSLSAGACSSDSTYSLTLDFDYSNPGNDFFEVYTRNNNYIGYFRLDQLPLTLPNFEKSGSEYDYVKVCINDQENCCKEEEIQSPKCE